LVRVVVGALPHLNPVARRGVSIGQVKAFTLVGPLNALVSGGSEELVCVAIEASVDLHLHTVRGRTIGNVEALVTEDSEISINQVP